MLESSHSTGCTDSERAAVFENIRAAECTYFAVATAFGNSQTARNMDFGMAVGFLAAGTMVFSAKMFSDPATALLPRRQLRFSLAQAGKPEI